MGHPKPPLVQLERQCRLTFALLPHVAALPWVDEEVIAQTFGQAMRVLNWIPEAPTLLGHHAYLRRTPRTKEEQRTYWREAKREERRRAMLLLPGR